MVGATTLDEYRAAHREGPRAGAALPAGARRRAVGRGHHRHPARAQGALRGAPRRADHRRRAGRRGHPLRPLHHRPVPARQGDRPGRRGRLPAADGDRLPAGRDRRAGARRCAGWRSRRWRWPKETDAGLAGAAGRPARRAGRPARAAGRADRRAGRTRRPHIETDPRGSRSSWSSCAREAERAERDGDLGKASPSCATARIPAAGARSSPRPTPDRLRGSRPRCSRRRSAADDIADVVAAWTGIPAGRLLEGETAKLLRMEEALGQRVVGQPEAVARRRPTPSGGPGPASPTRTGPPARSCSSGRPASARPSWPRRWPSSCSTTSGRWSAST